MNLDVNDFMNDLFGEENVVNVDVTKERKKQQLQQLQKMTLDEKIEYSKMKSLIEEVPIVIEQYSKSDGQIAPYLPISPHSLRKTWQHDDTAYNFVYDYLQSLTPIDWEEELNEELNNSRKIVSNLLNYEQFLDMLLVVAPDSQKRRMETKQLQKRYKERIREWKK